MSSSSTASESLPVGFRFHPTDEELIDHYLKLKMRGMDSVVHRVIPEVDICKFEPWELPAQSVRESDDREWFFFCRRANKYSNSTRSNRATKAGYWKVTGKERQIKNRATKAVIGKKRTLVFYKGRSPGKRTNWVVHEYNSVETSANQVPFVIYRLKEKPDDKKTPAGDDGEPSSHIVPHFENDEVYDTIPEAFDHSNVNLDSILSPSQPPDEYPSAQQQIDFTFPNGSCYAWNGLQLTSEANEPDEDSNDFVNSFFVNTDEDFWQEPVHPVLKVSTHPLAFPAHEDHGLRFLRSGRSSSSSSFLNEPAGMGEMQMARTPSGTSRFDQFKKDINVSIHNQFSTQNASSVSLTKDPPSINCLFLSTDSIIEKPCEPEKPRKPVTPFAASEVLKAPEKPCQPPRPIEIIKTGVTSRRILVKTEGLPTAESGNKVREAAAQNTAANLSQKEKRDAGLKEERKIVQDKSAYYVSPGGNWNSFFVFVEPPCKSSPPSVYFFSVLMGVLLFAVFAREALLYGDWC